MNLQVPLITNHVRKFFNVNQNLLLKSLGYEKYIMGEKILYLSINAFLWKKMTVRKRLKKSANICQHKNICISILNIHTNVCDIRKLSKPFNWFYNTLVKLVLQCSIDYEF